MPKRTYSGKLTHDEIIALFDNGTYRVDTDTGVVAARNGKSLYTFLGGKPDDPARWVRLYSKGKMRALPVAHCVWLYMAKQPIPANFEIHHRDTDRTNDAWDNLFCLFSLDHRKLHRSLSDGDESELRDLIQTTPF